MVDHMPTMTTTLVHGRFEQGTVCFSLVRLPWHGGSPPDLGRIPDLGGIPELGGMISPPNLGRVRNLVRLAQLTGSS